MAKVGAQRASELTGVSKSTIQRAMKSGKLSYEVDANERRVIDVAELERAFGLMPQDNSRPVGASVEAELEKATQMLEMERMKMRIRMLEDQLDNAKDHIDDLKGQRDEWQKQAQQVLLTSQYSQKQAEELKEELRVREERARIRRQQEVAARNGRPQQGAPRPAGKPAGPIEKVKQEAPGFGINGLWQKIRKSGQQNQPAAPTAAKDKATA